MSPITFCATEEVDFKIFNYVGPPIKLKSGDIIVFQVLEPPKISRVIKIIKANEITVIYPRLNLN